MRYVMRILPLFLLAMVACSKSNTPAASTAPETSAPASAAPAASASCAGLSHLSPLTDKGVKEFMTPAVSLEADNDNGQFYFNPSCVKDHGPLTVTVKNVGNVPHNFTVKSLGINDDIPVGKSITATVKLPASGTVAFYCEYHHASGMQGAFIVQ